MPRILVYVWFDLEDYVTKESHELPLRAFEILRKYNIPVTCKVVAEKVRSLIENGRKDVLQAISEHDVGYHLDTHSRHPTLYEYLANLEVRSGAKEFLTREREGLEFVKQTFSRHPSCFGHPGPTWAPHVYPALSEMGIPVYLDETSILNLDGQPYWYCGILNLNGANENFIVFDYSFERPDGVEKLKRKFAAMHKRLNGRGGTISLLWHLHTAINRKFWDEVNFGDGKNRSKEKYERPPAQPPEITDRAWRDFEELIGYMRSFADVEFITASDAVKMYTHTTKESVNRDELRAVARHFSKSTDYFEGDNLVFCPAEGIGIITKALSLHDASAELPDTIQVRDYLGPSSPWKSKGRTKILTKDLMVAASKVTTLLETEKQLPTHIPVGTTADLTPEDFLSTGSKLLNLILADRKVPSSLTVSRGKRPHTRYINASNFAKACKWKVLPRKFKAPKILEQIRLQAWTLKPAKVST